MEGRLGVELDLVAAPFRPFPRKPPSLLQGLGRPVERADELDGLWPSEDLVALDRVLWSECGERGGGGQVGSWCSWCWTNPDCLSQCLKNFF